MNINYTLLNFFNIISTIGGERIMLISATIVALLIIFWRKEEKLAGFILFNYGVTMSIVVLLKYLVHKGRNPLALVYESSYAFPSGHTAAAMVTFLLLIYLSKFVKNINYRILMRILGTAWLVLIIAARLYLRVHDIYDILASIIIATYVFYISLEIKIFKKGILKREVYNLEK